MKRRLFLALAAIVAIVGASAPAALAQPQLPFIPFGAVYTMSNAVDGNAVIVFERSLDGRLRRTGSIKTGGTGSGGALGSQGSIVVSDDEHWLLAVNAGSDEVSVFEVQPRGLRLTDRVNAGGTQPVSVAIHGRFVYVLDAGSNNIAGFTLSKRGQLESLPGSIRPLSAPAAGGAQVSFNAQGDLLVVTEKATNRIVTFDIGRDGVPGDANVQASSGATPFGFGFGRRDRLFVSEASGAVSSYDVDDDGKIQVISGSVPTKQLAACWIAVTPDGRFTYTTNNGSGSISGYAIGFGGDLTALDRDGRTALTGGADSNPADMALSRGGQFLYSVNTGAGTITGFFIAPNGRLIPLSSIGGLPASAYGLAGR